MSIRHPIIREPAIQPSHFYPLEIHDPFRDGAGWTRGGGDSFRDQHWQTVPREHVTWRGDVYNHNHNNNSSRDLVPRDFPSGRLDHNHGGTALVPIGTHSQSQTALPLTSSFFNPERQLGLMDQEMSRMAMEMRRMFSDMQHLMPADADPDSWRIKENFLLENPITHDNEGNRVFRLKFDVRQFRPEEIFVKTTGNELVVHAKHEEKGTDKSLHREYKRLYILPKDLNAENLVSKLTRDGVLSIEAKLPNKDGPKDRLIPIKHE